MVTDNLLSTVFGTAGDPAAGKTLAEYFLQRQYLKSREFNTPLVQPAFFSKLNLPKKAGQYAKFTRRGKLRGPETATDAADPESGAVLQYEQLHVPIEYINDYIGIGTQTQDTAWIDLAKDGKELIFEALRRYHNRHAQGTMLAGRYKPGHRNSSGVTTGAASYPHFWTEVQATYSPDWGGTFTFPAAPRYFANGKGAFADLVPDDRHKMDDYRRAVTRLRNAGANPMANGMFPAVISNAVEEDLQRDDKWFAQAIRDKRGQDALIKGHITDYAGITWILEDEPWCLELGGDQYALNTAGRVHVSQVFGMDAFGVMRLGGQDAGRPTFKIQDISVTGNRVTIGYLVPTQKYLLNRAWAANVIGPVTNPEANG